MALSLKSVIFDGVEYIYVEYSQMEKISCIDFYLPFLKNDFNFWGHHGTFYHKEKHSMYKYT